MSQNIEDLWNIHDSICSWIRFSDTKSAVILATNGVILSIIFSNITKFISLIGTSQFLDNFIVTVTIGAFAGIGSIIFCILSLIPRTKSSSDSLIYFGNIAKSEKFENFESYSKYTKKKLFFDNKLDDHILQDIFINSDIASNKFKYVQYATFLLGMAIFFLVMPILIIFW